MDVNRTSMEHDGWGMKCSFIRDHTRVSSVYGRLSSLTALMDHARGKFANL